MENTNEMKEFLNEMSKKCRTDALMAGQKGNAMRQKFKPTEGAYYENQGGGYFLCTEVFDDSAKMVNTKSGWLLVAHGVGVYPDGKIDWDYSSGISFIDRSCFEKAACLIERKLAAGTMYQIMRRCGSGFNHVFPGKLFTLDEAKSTAASYALNIVATGDMWTCLSRLVKEV